MERIHSVYSAPFQPGRSGGQLMAMLTSYRWP